MGELSGKFISAHHTLIATPLLNFYKEKPQGILTLRFTILKKRVQKGSSYLIFLPSIIHSHLFTIAFISVLDF
jgi:hypothetical protein